MYTELTIGSEVYKLRLTTRNSIALEKALGYNPIILLMRMDEGVMPKLNDLLIILQYMLQTYHHGMNLDKVYDLYDNYRAAGHSMFDLIPLFVEVFQESGYLPKENTVVEEDGKN